MRPSRAGQRAFVRAVVAATMVSAVGYPLAAIGQTVSPTARDLVDQARTAEQRGDNQDAARLLTAAIEKDGKLAEAHYLRGRIFNRLLAHGEQFVSGARRDLSRALELDADHPEWWAERAMLFEQLGDYQRAAADYGEAIKRKGDHPQWHLQRGLIHAALGELDSADRDNRRVIELLTTDGKAAKELPADQRQLLAFARLNNVGILIDLRKYDEAIRFGDEAVKVGEGIPNAHRNRAIAYLARAENETGAANDFETALDECTKTLELAPAYHAARVERGRALFGLKRYREAAAELNVALRMGGGDSAALLLLADCLSEVGQFDEAGQWLEFARKGDPKQPVYAWKLGCVQLAQGNVAESILSFEEALKIDKHYADAWRDLGYAYRHQGDQEKAEESFSTAVTEIDRLIEKDRKNVRLWLSKANQYDRCGKLDEAVNSYRRALQIDPDNKAALNSLAWILATHPLREKRDPAQALELAQRVVNQTPLTEADYLDTLAAAHAALGQFDKAVASEEQAVKLVANSRKSAFLERLAAFRQGKPYVRKLQSPTAAEPVVVSHQYLPVKSFAALQKSPDKKQSVRDIARAFRDAVVVVKSSSGVGTGMVIDPQGYVLTCAHVLPSIGDVTVIYYTTGEDGSETEHTAQAVVQAMDVRRDLALLRAEFKADVPAVMLGLGTRLEAGEPVTVIGNPGLGDKILGRTVLEGIVSSPRQKVGHQSLIHTSAAIQPGYSGGPMLNERGQVIGVVTSKGDERMGFAVPIDSVAGFLGVASK